jgi:hypothetical protein
MNCKSKVNCKSCWWQEGGLCYQGDPERQADGRSKKPALVQCENYLNKRKVLNRVIPDEMLVIVSELTERRGGG